MNRRPSQSRSGYDSFSPQHTAHFRADQPDGDFFDPKPPKSLGRRVLLILLALILAILLINVAVNQFVRVERVTVPATVEWRGNIRRTDIRMPYRHNVRFAREGEYIIGITPVVEVNGVEAAGMNFSKPITE